MGLASMISVLGPPKPSVEKRMVSRSVAPAGERGVQAVVYRAALVVAIEHPGPHQQAVHIEQAHVVDRHGNACFLALEQAFLYLDKALRRVDGTFRDRRAQQLPTHHLRRVRC